MNHNNITFNITKACTIMIILLTGTLCTFAQGAVKTNSDIGVLQSPYVKTVGHIESRMNIDTSIKTILTLTEKELYLELASKTQTLPEKPDDVKYKYILTNTMVAENIVEITDNEEGKKLSDLGLLIASYSITAQEASASDVFTLVPNENPLFNLKIEITPTPVDPKDPDFPGMYGIYVSEKGTGNGATPEDPISIHHLTDYINSAEYNTFIPKIKFYIAVKDQFTAVTLPKDISMKGHGSIYDAHFTSLTLSSAPTTPSTVKIINLKIETLNLSADVAIERSLILGNVTIDPSWKNVISRCTFNLGTNTFSYLNIDDAIRFNSCIFWKSSDILPATNVSPPAKQCHYCASNDATWTIQAITKSGLESIFRPGRIMKEGKDNMIISGKNKDKFGPHFIDPLATENQLGLQPKSILVNRGAPITPTP